MAAVLLALALALALPSGAQAHAVLISSSPANDELLDEAPKEIHLRFNEDVRVVKASAVFADGSSLALPTGGSGDELSFSLPQPPGHGTIIVSYRVVSEDGHPVAGSIVFHVGKASAGRPARGEDASLSLKIAIWIVRGASLLALAYVVGGRFFQAVFDPSGPSPRPAFIAPPALLLFGLGVYLQGLDELGLGLTVAGFEPLLTSLTGGPVASALGSTLAILIAVSPRSGRRATGAAVATSAMVLASAALTLTGHCSIVSPQWLARTCMFVHGGVMLFWIGSLVPLWRLSRTSDQSALNGFSLAIPAPFAAMLCAGLGLAWFELPSVGSVTFSLFGRVLVAKIALVMILCMFAAYNRFWLTAPAIAGDRTARRRLRSSVAAEIFLAVAIVGAASLWRFAGPEQFQYAPPPEAVSLHLHSEQAMAQLEFQTALDGASSVEVSVMTPQFDAMEPRAVTLRLSNPGLGIEALKYELKPLAGGAWAASGLPVRSGSGWMVDVRILIDDFTTAHLAGDLGGSDGAAASGASTDRSGSDSG